MNQNIEFKAIPGQFNIDEAQGIVECFVAGIGNKDSVGDVLISGAFTKSLTRRKPRVVWGHNWNDPIGKVLEIYEVAPGDRRLPMKMLSAGIGGLYARVQFNLSSEKGKEAFANVAFFGQEQEWSIGYKTLDSIFDPNIQANILKEVELYEVSPVLHGANQLTGTISVKSDDLTMIDEPKGGVMMFETNRGPMTGKPTGMMPHRRHNPTPNILEANKPGIGDERRNQLEMELSVRAGAPVKVRLAEENMVIFDRITPDGAPTTYRVAYNYTGREFMFGKPEKVSVQTVYVPSSEESGSRVVIPAQMPSMPMHVKPQGNAYMGNNPGETGMIMPKSYENDEKWVFDEDFADLANIISDSLDVKVGRALSGKNMSRLKAILENLQEVIASAEKEVEVKSDYVIPVHIENAFQTKQLLDPIFDYHRVESHVTEDGIVVTSGVTEEFIEAISVAEKALGRTLSGGLGKLGRSARGAARFDPNAWDGDGDGVVQEGTPFKRPAIPGINDRASGGRVDASAATRAFEQQGGKPDKRPLSGLASTSVEPKREVLRGEIVKGPGSVSATNKIIDGSSIPDKHADILKNIISDLDSDEEMLSATRKNFLDAVRNGDFDDYLKLQNSERNFENYITEDIGETLMSAVKARLQESMMPKKFATASRKQQDKIDELIDETLDEWSDSVFRTARRISANKPPSEKEIQDAKKESSQKRKGLIEALQSGESISEEDFFFEVQDIVDKDPTTDLKELAKELQKAVEKGIEENPEDSQLNALWNDYFKNGLRESVFDDFEDTKLDSEFLSERVKAKRTLTGGLASSGPIDDYYGISPERSSIYDWDDKKVIKYASDYPGMFGVALVPTLRSNDEMLDEIVEKFDELLEKVKNNEYSDSDSFDALSRIAALKDKDKIKEKLKEISEDNFKYYPINSDERTERAALGDALENYMLSVLDGEKGYDKNGPIYDTGIEAVKDSIVDDGENRVGGFASVSRRGDGTMLSREGQIQRDERGNVDPTEARERRAQFDQNIFKKLKELGLNDDEIEQLTGVPDGGVVREGGKPAQYVPDDIRRGGLASQSRVSGPGRRGSRNSLQSPSRTPSEDGISVSDNDIFRDFLLGMSGKEIAEKYNLSGARTANLAANREFRRLSQNSESQANSDMDLVMYRASGLSVRDAADLFGMSPREVRKTDRRLAAKLRKENDDDDLLYLRNGLTLEQTGKLLGVEPAKLRQREIGITRKRREDRKQREGRAGLASSSGFDDDDVDYDEALGPRNPGARRGMPSDPVGDTASDNIDRGRNAQAVRQGLASESRQMDMTLEEYGELQSVLEKYLDDSQVGGVGSDEDMEVLKNIIDKIDDSVVANDAIPMTDDEIDSYVDTLTRMNEFGSVDDAGDKKAINELIDSLKKTKKSKDGYFTSDALEQSGTRLTPPSAQKRRPRVFSSQSGTTNPHRKLEIELSDDEIGILREEVELLSRTAENKNIFKSVSEKLEKANNGKFSIDDKEYEDLVKAIEQSKSRSGMISSDLLGLVEQASESNDGKYSSLNMRGGGLASSNKGRKPNNGAPPDITEAMQKDYIFWARSGKANNLQLVQDALRDFEAEDGQLTASKWRRLRTMHENLGPGSARGGRRVAGARSRVGLASTGGFGDGDRESRTSRPGAITARGLSDIGAPPEEVGKGGAMGADNTRFAGLSLDEAVPNNWKNLTNDEKFEWLMYEGNPEKVKEKDQKMSQAAYQGAIKKVVEDMERDERRSMTPEERRAQRNAAREAQGDEISEREIERQGDARRKRQAEKEKPKDSQRTYKPKANAQEGREQRVTELESYQEKIDDIKNKLNELDFEGDFDIVAEDIWETVNGLLGNQDMTKKSINDAVEALEEFIEINSPGENKYEKLSVSSANSLLKQLNKTKAKYAEDPWIVDDLPLSGGLASRSRSRLKDGDRPRPGSREMPQSNAKRENEMKKIIDLAQQVLDEMKSKQEANKGRRSRVGMSSSSAPKAMITDEATFFKDIESSLVKEIRTAQKANNQTAVKGLTKLQEIIQRNEASKTGSRRTNVGSIYLTDTEADMVLEGLMFALDNQIEVGGDKRIEWYTKLLEKVSQAAMSTFINKNR